MLILILRLLLALQPLVDSDERQLIFRGRREREGAYQMLVLAGFDCKMVLLVEESEHKDPATAFQVSLSFTVS